MNENKLALHDDGATLHRGAAVSAIPALERAFAGLNPSHPGLRVAGEVADVLRPLFRSDGAIGSIAAATLGPHCRAVRAIMFDKNPAANWALAWHQDRVICVREHRSVAGFENWTVKRGLLHVSPPFAVLAGMLTLRVHLDPVPHDNAPLLIALGSHRLGLVTEDAICQVVTRTLMHPCLADPGDVWCYATPILHASARAECPRRRRVLQVDFAARDLPGGLCWADV